MIKINFMFQKSYSSNYQNCKVWLKITSEILKYMFGRHTFILNVHI